MPGQGELAIRRRLSSGPTVKADWSVVLARIDPRRSPGDIKSRCVAKTSEYVIGEHEYATLRRKDGDNIAAGKFSSHRLGPWPSDCVGPVSSAAAAVAI